jgi:hypothetical protein
MRGRIDPIIDHLVEDKTLTETGSFITATDG